MALQLDAFSDLFICPHCDALDSGKYCSNCGESLGIPLDSVSGELTKRYKYIGFSYFHEWLAANAEIAAYHGLASLDTLPCTVLCRERLHGSGLRLELIMIIDGDAAVNSINQSLDVYFDNIRSAIGTKNQLPRKDRSKAYQHYLEKITIREIVIKNSDGLSQEYKNFSRKTRIRTKTGTVGGNFKRMVLSDHFLKSTFYLRIQTDISIFNFHTGEYHPYSKKLYDIVDHQAEVVARQTKINPFQVPKRSNNWFLQLLLTLSESFRDYFKMFFQYFKNPDYFSDLVASKKVIPFGRIAGLYFTGLICSITIPWILTGGYLNSGNLSSFSNLPPFISDLAELVLELVSGFILCVLLHAIFRLYKRRGSLSSLLLCYLFLQAFLQLVNRPLEYLTGPLLSRLVDYDSRLQYPIKVVVFSLFSFISLYFLYPILFSIYRATRVMITVAFLSVALLVGFVEGFVDGFVETWGRKRFGTEVNYNALQIYFKDGVTTSDVDRLKKFLVSSGFENGKRQSIQLVKQDSIYIFRMVVDPTYVDKLKDMRRVLSGMASEISNYVFDGAPVRVHACNEWFTTIEVFDMAPELRWVSYQTSEYQIRYPPSWRLEEGGTGDTRFLLYSQDIPIEITLVTEDLTGLQVTLEEYIEQGKSQMDTVALGIRFVENRKYYSNGRDFQKLQYNIVNKEVELRVLNYIWVKNEKAYLLVFRCPLNNLDKGIINAGEAVLNSFNFK